MDNPEGGSDATHAEFISVEDLNDDLVGLITKLSSRGC